MTNTHKCLSMYPAKHLLQLAACSLLSVFLFFFTDELLVLVAFLLGAVTGGYLICSAVTLDRNVIRGESARPVAIMTAAVMPPITATRVNTNILARSPQEAARGTGDRCEVRFAIQGRLLYHVKQR